MDSGAETVVLTVVNVAGEILFGPEAASNNEPVLLLRDRIQTNFAPVGTGWVTLLYDEQVLQDGCTLRDQISDSHAEVVAVFGRHSISDEEREGYLGRLHSQHSRSRWKHIFNEMSEEARLDYDLALAVVGMDAPEFVCDQLWAHRDFVVLAVSQNTFAMKYAHGDLKADKQLVLLTLRLSGSMLQYVDPALKADRDVALTAVRQDRTALVHVDRNFTDDKDFVIDVVGSDGMALSFIRPMFRADKQVVCAAVGHNGMALQFACETLQADGDVVDAAVAQCPQAERFRRTAEVDCEAIAIEPEHVPEVPRQQLVSRACCPLL